MISVFKMAPSIVLKSCLVFQSTKMCLMEKTGVLDELHSGMSYTALGCKLNVNETTIYSK